MPSVLRYHIDTIPVWDAMKLEGECLLCALKRKVELGEVDRYLGASVMEPDTRVEVNSKGFCQHHQEMLFAVRNSLGHALMLESHLTETREKLRKTLKSIRTAAKGAAGASLMDKLSGKAPSPKKALESHIAALDKLTCTCIVCDSINDNMNRYLHTFFHLYKTDTEFRRRFVSGKGACLPHTAQLLRAATEELSAAELADFAEAMEKMENEAFDRMQEDIAWFIKKFDYRFSAEPWKNAKGSVERSVNKLRGWCIGEEPNPKE